MRHRRCGDDVPGRDSIHTENALRYVWFLIGSGDWCPGTGFVWEMLRRFPVSRDVEAGERVAATA